MPRPTQKVLKTQLHSPLPYLPDTTGQWEGVLTWPNAAKPPRPTSSCSALSFVFTMCHLSVIKNPIPKLIIVSGKASLGCCVQSYFPWCSLGPGGIMMMFCISLEKFSVCTACSFFRCLAISHLDRLAFPPYPQSSPHPSTPHSPFHIGRIS